MIHEAKAKAEEFCGQSIIKLSLEDALSVYKVLLLEPSMMSELKVDASVIRSGFRGLALSLHPDKNRHPISTEAFQNASELF